jgi:lactaldehyde dehydrogenase/glycolaldehyde dehydrogenase
MLLQEQFMTAPVQHPMYIDGQFVTWQGDAWIDVTNPATEEVLSRIPDGTAEDARRAIDAADKAQPAWEALPAIERAGWLRKIAAGIRENASEISALIVAEGGKIQQLAEVEVNFTADYIDYMSEWARRYEGEILQSDRPGENIFVFKRPLGVTTGILPWNFPFFLIARKLAPALLTGNTIVIKPSEFTPNNAIAFARIVHEVGLPKGVFNLVLGRGETVGQELAGNPKVAMVSMTGSVAAGEKIMAAAAKNITKVCLELGGKAPAIVLDDADLELAVKAIVDSRVINTGQVCNCAERVYVQKGIYDRFVNRLGEAMKAVQFGNPAQRNDIAMGPLINAAALARVEAKVARAVSEGARVVLGGKAVEGKGYFYPPTLLLDVRQDMAIMHEETFGPVLPVVAFDTLEDALAMANDSDYGLTSSVYTQNLNTAMKAIKGLKFGETYINRENFEAMQGFHAGWRKSGIGGADGKHGLEEYLQTQMVYLQA